MDSLIGQPIRRKEDRRLLTGRGRFVDDISLSGQAYACFLRSPHAHARVRTVDVRAAASAPGVLAVLTGEDYAADGLGALQHHPISADHLDITKPSFTPEEIGEGPLPPQWPIVRERVRYLGEIVALVIAETAAAALDAAELIAVDYAVLPAVTDAQAALATDAPQLWPEPPGNLCVTAAKGDRAAVAAALARAAHVVRLETLNQRISAAPLEPRAAIGEYDAATGSYTLHCPSQGVHRNKNTLAPLLGVAGDRLRIVTPDVGGGFGVRSPCYPESALILWGARRVGRPVKWTATRQEAFLCDFHARDIHTAGTLALDRDGRFLGLSLDYLGNLGAYPATLAVLSNLLRMAAGVYDIPALHVRVRGVVTNTLPIGVYRGAGRPESNFILERLIDRAAAALGLDRAELRRRNIIPASKLPYPSPLGHCYDSGAFAENMEKVLETIDWAGFPARRAAAHARGKRAGIAVVNYLESPTGFPNERTDIRVLPEGKVTAVIGTQASGQGHETSFAQIVASQLQLPLDQVAIAFGDSALAVSGAGSHSDRSMRLGGTILLRASESIVERGRRLAAHFLEAAESDIAYAEGRFTVAGTDRGLGLFELAALALDPRTPAALGGPLAATEEIGTRLHAHPNGAVACELEVDPETGATRLLRYVTVDDVGLLINPMIVEGQVHGGIAQGVGQALLEHCLYDSQSGQLLAGSFLDYGMPRAEDFPGFTVATNPIAALSNPLGIKGAGECGITPATSVIINAILDALQAEDTTALEMPATAERVWRAQGHRASEGG